MTIRPISLYDANGFVTKHHRHHQAVVGHRFSIGVFAEDLMVGVAIVGRPVARMINQETVAEVTRLCTDGTPNACSKLYGACARICREMGFEKIQTYILEDEPGASLKASGWRFAGMTHGGSWSRNVRARNDKHPTVPKGRWELVLKKGEG